MSRTCRSRLWIPVALCFFLPTTAAYAQKPIGVEVAKPDTTAEGDLIWMSPINVTATRTRTSVFDTPAPVTVIDREDLRERAPNTVTDLFTSLPGLDVNGVGPNQARPTIRGQRGQRILLLEDGMRLNNTRRQQDFGEIVGLVDLSALERVEVVRGPSSVLYGSDAIGGVVNLITRTPEVDEEGTRGSVGYRYSTHDNQNKVESALVGRYGALGFVASGSFRDADAYHAPEGSFGEITLDSDTPVSDTGVQDESLYLHLSYDYERDRRAFVKYERYRADEAGFGFVDPEAYAPELPLIQILYPFQTFTKYTIGYRTTRLQTSFLDDLDFVAYLQDNERRLDLNVELPFGPEAPPGAGLEIHSENFTDLETFGLRLEAKKSPTPLHLVTYGLDFFRDDSKNTDFNRTTVVGFGPPMVEESDTPQVPNATLRNVGLFLQDEISLRDRVTAVLGVRYHDVHAESERSGETNRTLVGATSVVVHWTERVNAIVSVGRGFRAPNLVERFFNGPTPEGAAFQAPNPDLEPETSLNLDLGIRYRAPWFFAEGFVFRNRIDDGIRIAPTGETENGLPVFRNVNVDELRFRGVELSADAFLPSGGYFGGNFTWVDTEDVNEPNNPIGESFSRKLNLYAGYRHPSGRLWGEYQLRHNSERDDAIPIDNPIGSTLPAFTIHALRGGGTLFRTGRFEQRVGISLENLTDELYSEFANVSFFRPAPGRSLTVTWEVVF